MAIPLCEALPVFHPVHRKAPRQVFVPKNLPLLFGRTASQTKTKLHFHAVLQHTLAGRFPGLAITINNN